MADSDELDKINNDMAMTLLPAISLVAVFMLLGMFGNPLVAYYYGCRAKATSSYHFIVALSVFDLITCCISMPLEIVDMRHSFKFDNSIACKLLRFVNYFASISSGCILIAIAVDRYRKICHPFNKQITLKATKIIIVIVCLFSAGVSWPSAVFYGSHEVNVTSSPGVVGFDCTTSREESFKMYITIYNIVLFVFFIIAITCIIVLYCLVGRRLFNLKTFRFYATKPKAGKFDANSQNSSDVKTSTGVVSRTVSNVIEIPDEIDDKPLATIKELDSYSRPVSASSSRQTSAKSENRVHPQDLKRDSTLSDIKFTENTRTQSLPKGVSSISIQFENDSRKGSAGSRFSRSTRTGSAASTRSHVSGLSEYSDSDFVPAVETRDSRGSVDIDKNTSKKLHAQNVDTRKYTLITLSISIAFVVSFLPYLGLVTWRTLAKEHEVHLLSKAAYCTYQIFIRSFLISSALNPLIYGFLNTEFRGFVKTICQKCCCCCCYMKKKETIHDITQSN